ncbi:DUF402 domain-containing protein [Mesomycoplasma moatsii]|uniref:DUF402 domain-containing protein n=1 Tax=Mesomycoplasma moatsii TaxID=171287 RepID=UPI0003B4E9E6
MKKNINQKFFNVQAFKYDGELYRQWNGVKVIDENDDYVCCLLYKTKVNEKNKQKWIIKEPTLWFFSKKNFFNMTIVQRKTGLHYYINLASPFFIENENIKYIDFDFDIKIYPNKPFQIVDHYDFQKNKEKWYNVDLINTIYQNLVIIAKKYQTRENVFDEFYIHNLFQSLIILKEIDIKSFDLE